MPEMIFLDPKDRDQFIKVLDLVRVETSKTEDPITVLDVVAATMRQAKAYEMRHALESVDDVIRNSQGVVGWHLNGDLAPWGQLGVDTEVAEALSATPEVKP